MSQTMMQVSRAGALELTGLIPKPSTVTYYLCDVGQVP